ncbi:hypothetical protein [Rhizobium sp. MHM7A]|uniref:hypothetical protein n=1 Tax=Rhizobium sp. MHM7A TaxID=2583233 RepID=UPI0011071615|nr:hypothetical protein [Rhizobium sp. MHM7A]TLX16046.1 hypothetical protein FFR93_01630 [Rhizobium sp. MHM7A]
MNLVGSKITDVHSKILTMGLHAISGSPQHVGYQYPAAMTGTEERVTLTVQLDNEVITRAFGTVETPTDDPWKPVVNRREIVTLLDI